MPPWGYTSVEPSDYSELAALSKIATNAIKGVYGIIILNSNCKILFILNNNLRY